MVKHEEKNKNKKGNDTAGEMARGNGKMAERKKPEAREAVKFPPPDRPASTDSLVQVSDRYKSVSVCVSLSAN